MIRVAILLIAMFAPLQVARAEWFEASSDHFVVYADDSLKDITSFSRRLERFHSALEIATGRKLGAPSPSNRVTIYVVRSEREVRKLANAKRSYLGGFYISRAGGSLAVVPRVDVRGKVTDGTMLTLLHEYAHHFTHATSTFPMPRWMSEGGAEFFATASFEPNGNVMLGRPAQHRAYELYLAVDVSAEELLDPEVYEAKKGKSSAYNAFYGRAWLLYHYLTFEPERRGQMIDYIKRLYAGEQMRSAALAAFGDFKALDSDLDKYLRRRQLHFMDVKHAAITEAPVKVRQLSPGEIAMMPVRIESKLGVDDEEAKALVLEGRAIAARYPQDASVLAMLAENEFDAGNDDAAIAAADRALALDPTKVNAYVQKGYAMFRKASKADDEEKAYAEAIRPFLALNRLENDHPMPLIWFYRSFVDRGAAPSPLAVQGLERAAQLAPFDLGLRMDLAKLQIHEGRFAAARFNLKPLAYYPHPNEGSEAAKLLLDQIEGKTDAPVAAGN